MIAQPRVCVCVCRFQLDGRGDKEDHHSGYRREVGKQTPAADRVSWTRKFKGRVCVCVLYNVYETLKISHYYYSYC